MIAHVAAAGERSGRVVLWHGGSPTVSRFAIDAAMVLGKTFQAEVESLYVEDQQLFDFAEFPFARTISTSGGDWEPLPVETLERKMRALAAALHQQVAEAASAAGLPCQSRVMRDDPLRALSLACAMNGPWNVIAVCEPLTAGDGTRLANLFEQVRDTTGVIVTGPLARRSEGPLVAVVEEFYRLGPMLKTALRIAETNDSQVRLCVVGNVADELGWMESEARILCADPEFESRVSVESLLAANDDPAPLLDMLRVHKPGLALAQYGGRLIAPEASLRPLTRALECPLLLVR